MDKRPLIILSLILSFIAACYFPIPMWPHLPDRGTCRYFKMTTWADNKAPWNEVNWGPEVVQMDEPLLPMWGWPGSLDNPADVCGPLGIPDVKHKIEYLRTMNPGAKVWINWSSEELSAITNSGCNDPSPFALNADIVSVDSYGGIWDWPNRTIYMEEIILRNLQPGQQMGLVPEGHYAPDWGVHWSPIDYVMLNTLYFDWAMKHDNEGKIFAMAPFTYGPCADGVNLCIADQPQLVELLSALSVEYPYCGPTP